MVPVAGRTRCRMAVVVLAALGALLTGGGCQAASVVKVVKTAAGWQLQRDGQPYTIKGAGGSASKPMLKGYGGNSWRTWDAANITDQLDEAQRLGMTVTVGIWLGHKDQGFDWHNPQAVADQFARAQRFIRQYRDHPALLIWALGNEMESGGESDDPVMWKAVNALAEMVHREDPNHPTMTVIAELGGNNIKNINQYCPAIDIVGINSYAGAQSIPDRYIKAGGAKPYVLTEYGPPGTWEYWKKSPWGAAEEMTSTEKAEWYAKPYTQNVVKNAKQCLGAYAFTWGSKQEASATWFGMLLPDGRKLAVVDALSALWTGRPAPNPCPVVEPLQVKGPRDMPVNTPITVTLTAQDPAGGPLNVNWVLAGEPRSYNTGGANEAAPPTYPEAIVASDAHHADLKIPGNGRYRLFAYVRNAHDGAAMANLALHVGGAGPASPVSKVSLPAAVYDEAGRQGLPWTPSGYMGNAAAIKMDDQCKDNPHSGQTCLKVQYTATNNWGGVVWQDPPNDWGNAPGGRDLTGATRLSFWARGAQGGEVINFAYGILDEKAKYPNSSHGTLDKLALTKDWREYHIDLAGKDLSCIKTGFSWSAAATGAPLTFYLDDIRWEGKPGAAAPAAIATGPLAPIPAGVKAVVYDEAGRLPQPWAPSGYMGHTEAIHMDDAWTQNPHTGRTCLRVEYNDGGNWGGVVWQDPPNDWGKLAGGHSLVGAKKLTFWARGENGGEVVSVAMGLLDARAAFHDSASAKLDLLKLTKEWKQYSIDLAGKDLSQIKTGFSWTVAGQGQPLVFYLDDVQYEMSTNQRAPRPGVVTARDVANALGLSQPTVSRILSGAAGHRVSMDTRERVLQQARAMGYRPNAVARSLRRGHTDVIGLYTQHDYDARNEFLAAVLGGLQRACARKGLDLLLFTALSGREPDATLARLHDGRIDGLLLHATSGDPIAARVRDSSLPVVSIADALPGIPAVTCDDAGGVRELLTTLWARGYRRFRFAALAPDLSSVERRVAAFECFFSAGGPGAGADAAVVRIQDEDPGPAEQWLTAGPEPTAVCCWNDRTAYNLLRRCHEQGIAVPGQLAVTGFDGFVDTKLPAQHLLTVACPWDLAAEAALDALAYRIEGHPPPQETVLPVHVLEGNTA